MCAVGHSLGIPACGFVVTATWVIHHSNAVLVGWHCKDSLFEETWGSVQLEKH